MRGRQTAFTNAGFQLDEDDEGNNDIMKNKMAAVDAVSQSSSGGSLPKKPPISS